MLILNLSLCRTPDPFIWR